MNKTMFKVNLNNPGHFFACCGILEVANHTFKTVKGCFSNNKFELYTDDNNPMVKMINKIIPNNIEFKKDLTKYKKNEFKEDENLKKVLLPDNLESDTPVTIVTLDMRIDFWNHLDNRRIVKLFAGQEHSVKLLLRWLIHLKKIKNDLKIFNEPFEIYVYDLPSGLDTSTSCYTLDVGFSLNELKIEQRKTYPIVEFFAYIGIQSYSWQKIDNDFMYDVWDTPLPIPVTRAVASGALKLPNQRRFKFKITKNGQKQILLKSEELF